MLFMHMLPMYPETRLALSTYLPGSHSPRGTPSLLPCHSAAGLATTIPTIVIAGPGFAAVDISPSPPATVGHLSSRVPTIHKRQRAGDHRLCFPAWLIPPFFAR